MDCRADPRLDFILSQRKQLSFLYSMNAPLAIFGLALSGEHVYDAFRGVPHSHLIALGAIFFIQSGLFLTSYFYKFVSGYNNLARNKLNIGHFTRFAYASYIVAGTACVILVLAILLRDTLSLPQELDAPCGYLALLELMNVLSLPDFSQFVEHSGCKRILREQGM